jgi:nitrous oxide reductase accessory protein NosL
MLHTVEIGSFYGDVIAAMSNMMRWLDNRGSQPVIFRQIPGDVTAFLLGFSSEAEALAFVCAFGGRLLRSEPQAAAVP